QEGRPLELYERPGNRFVASFIGQPKMNFLPVSAQETDGRIALYLDPGGTLLLPDATALGLEPGARAELGIRPNEIDISAEGNLAGKVALVEQLGSATILHISIEGLDDLLTVERPGKWTASIGEPVRLAIRPEHVHVFDLSGNRLTTG